VVDVGEDADVADVGLVRLQANELCLWDGRHAMRGVVEVVVVNVIVGGGISSSGSSAVVVCSKERKEQGRVNEE